MADGVDLTGELLLVADVVYREKAVFGHFIGLVDESYEGLCTLGIHMQYVGSDALEDTNELLNIITLLPVYHLFHVPVHILVHPVFISHNRVVLVKLTLHYHSQNLLVLRELV